MICHQKTLFFAVLACLVLVFSGCKGEKEYHAIISTEYGDITILLYNHTPKHRDNFIKLVNEGFYDSLLFHRVIDNFMIQGGDPNSRTAAPGEKLGSGGPQYFVDAEIGSPHIRGAVAGARTPHIEKKSSASQFYIVTGKKVTEEYLQEMESMKRIKYNDAQRKLYLEEGGYPYLDMEYTVFGEVISGIEVADKISKMAKDERDRPLKDVRMKIKMNK